MVLPVDHTHAEISIERVPALVNIDREAAISLGSMSVFHVQGAEFVTRGSQEICDKGVGRKRDVLKKIFLEMDPRKSVTRGSVENGTF